jgi:CTP:molybdopterin cytidylyltransferase MocA
VTTAGLVLAAGAGRRMGGPKALVELAGEPLLARAVRLLRDGGCDEVVVVVGAEGETVARRAEALGCAAVHADGWEEGMSASLRAGLAHLTAGPHDACVVALVDQPLLGAEAVRRLVAADAVAAVATYAGAPRNPVLLRREVWAEVAATATGDAGARTWLRAHPDRVRPVPCDGTGSPLDLDTPADLAAFAAGHDDAPVPVPQESA